MRVIVIGGSLGGLTVALTLRDAGCSVDIYERASLPLIGQGAGIVLNPATTRYFTENTRLPIDQMSVATNYVRYIDREGDIVDEQLYTYRLGSYTALYRGLLNCFDADRYHLGEAVIGFEQDDNIVTVQLTSGRHEQCDLLVCADGIRSTSRKQLLPGVSIEYAGYIAWRGTLDEADLSSSTFSMLHKAITYHIMPGSHILTYPIPGIDSTTGSTRSFVNWLWYRNVPKGPELEHLMTDKSGVVREVSVSPGTVSDNHVEKMRQDASSLLPKQLVEIIQKTPHPFLQAIVDCAVPRMVFGRVCLIGDAAFVARPHAAAGTAKAAEDGWKLAEAIKHTDGDVVTALNSWEVGQLELGKSVLTRTRDVGQRVQFEGTWRVGEPLAFGLYTIGDSLMP